nr:MAG TPA: hypothetical protein [Caudoviricetes sp.]
MEINGNSQRLRKRGVTSLIICFIIALLPILLRNLCYYLPFTDV